jgi:reactive intermediate/imine deaminase
MGREAVHSSLAPQAIGTYSQAIKAGGTVYLSGQIPLIPQTMEMVQGTIEAQIEQVLDNLEAVASAAGGGLGDVAKLTVYLTDLACFPAVNEVMARRFREPFPARAVVGVAALPRGAAIEIDAVMALAD